MVCRLLHRKQQIWAGPLELVNGRRSGQRLQEADGILDGELPDAGIIEAEPGRPGQPQQLLHQRGFARLSGSLKHHEAESGEHFHETLS